ncbi:MAG: hypothetical protein LBL07_01610 [Tannerella sp.]|nr:hypothetical protein [Tannerella sp.]
MDARGSEATLPCPDVRSAFQDVLHPYNLIRPYCSLIFNPYNIMFYTRINKIKVFNNRKGFLGLLSIVAPNCVYTVMCLFLNGQGRTARFGEHYPKFKNV